MVKDLIEHTIKEASKNFKKNFFTIYPIVSTVITAVVGIISNLQNATLSEKIALSIFYKICIILAIYCFTILCIALINFLIYIFVVFFCRKELSIDEKTVRDNMYENANKLIDCYKKYLTETNPVIQEFIKKDIEKYAQAIKNSKELIEQDVKSNMPQYNISDEDLAVYTNLRKSVLDEIGIKSD